MVPQKIHEHFFSKPKVKKGKNVLVYNFYLILKFHKKKTRGNYRKWAKLYQENLQFSFSVPV